MNEHDHSAFFGDHSFDKYFYALNDEQKGILDDFYHEHCTPSIEDRFVQNDQEQCLPAITYGRTPHNLFVAARWSLTAHQNPEDFRIITCQKDGQSMRTENYEVLEVQHRQTGTRGNLERIIYAKGETRSKKIALELGATVSWLETFEMDGEDLLLSLPVRHFTLPHYEQ